MAWGEHVKRVLGLFEQNRSQNKGVVLSTMPNKGLVHSFISSIVHEQSAISSQSVKRDGLFLCLWDWMDSQGVNQKHPSLCNLCQIWPHLFKVILWQLVTTSSVLFSKSTTLRLNLSRGHCSSPGLELSFLGRIYSQAVLIELDARPSWRRQTSYPHFWFVTSTVFTGGPWATSE